MEVVYEGTILKITISIGLVSMTTEENLEALMRKSDNALYKAKKEGRNRVCVL